MHAQKGKQVVTLDAQGRANEKGQKVSDVQNQALGGSERVQELLDRVAVLRYQCNDVALKAQHKDVSFWHGMRRWSVHRRSDGCTGRLLRRKGPLDDWWPRYAHRRLM